MPEPTETYRPTRPFTLSLILFLCSLAYLFPEIAFNSALVNTAGGYDSDPQTLKNVELYGRYISGIGASLLVADLLLKGRLSKSWPRIMVSTFVIFSLVWPAVFFGQRLLIDHFVVNPATPAERQQAYYAQLLRKALISNTVKIDGIPFDAEAELAPHDKTFLAMFGGMTFRNDALMANLDTYKVAIARQYIGNLASKDFNDYYRQYRDAREEVVAGYKRFDAGVTRYHDAMGSTQAEADKVFARIDEHVGRGYSDYQDARNALLRETDDKAKAIAGFVPDHFKYKGRCTTQRCLDNQMESYNRRMDRIGLTGIEDEYWIIAEEIDYGAGYFAGKAFTAVMSGGLTLVGDAIGALNGQEKPTHTYSYTNDPHHYYDRLLPKMEPKLKAKTGYEFGVDNLAQFRSHPNTSKQVAKTLSTEGLSVPQGWQLNDRATIVKLVGGKAAQQAQDGWNREMRSQGLSLTPEDDWDDFQLDPAIQDKIRSALGDRFYQNPTSMDLNNQQFMREVVQPAINREADRLIKQLSAQKAEFAEGGLYYESGTAAIRAITIPPISMGISLFLVLLTAAKLPIKGYQLVSTIKRPMRRAESTGLAVISVVIVLGIIVYPLSALSSRFTEKTSTVSYFLNQMQLNSQAGTALVMRWVMNTQPIIQPIGAHIENEIGFVSNFKDRAQRFKLLDESVFQSGSDRGTDADTNETFQSVAVTVKVNVPNAKIRIMNIGPVYQKEMALAPGNYDVEVSAPGRQAHRAWYRVSGAGPEYVIDIDLK